MFGSCASSNPLKLLLNILRWCIIVLLCFWFLLRFIPLPALLDKSNSSKALYDSRGKLLSLSLTRDEKYRLYVPLGDISPSLVEATLLYEDKHFYSHPGINPYSIIRAITQTLSNYRKPIGGSTITMQLARLRFSIKTRSILGKLKQILLALAIERQYTKHEILEAYLNLAPYGSNVEGIGAASLVYYRRHPRQITLNESLTLAVLPQYPSRRWREKGRQDLESARARLVSKWIGAFGVEEVIPREFLFNAADVPTRASHLFLRVQDFEPQTNELYTTLDSDIQSEAEDVLADSLTRYKEFGIENGAIILAELPEMKVRAYVGSANYVNQEILGFVNGLSSPRSPGSLLKPFVYGLALQQGRILPESMLADVPIRLAAYKPENFERNFLGPISASDALVKSRNIPALEVFRRLDDSSMYNFLGQAGVQRLLSKEHYGIALVLGGLGVTPEEVAQLYGILGNNGEYQKLDFFDLKRGRSKREELFSPEVSYLVLDMLSKNPPALGRFRDRKIPWKTGTSYGSKDAWAAGIVGRYVLVVWLGNFNGKPNSNLVGRDFAGPLFFAMVDRLISQGVSVAPRSTVGLNLKKVQVCALSGALPSKDCPHKKESWFIPGVSPINNCSIHQRIEINSSSGLRACPGTHGEDKVYEVWSSEMQHLFQKAGLQRNLPPAYEDSCAMSSSSQQKIRIITPEEHLQYYIESHRDLELQFLSAVPGDSKRVSWFVNDLPIGEVNPTEALYWKAHIGDFEVSVVDDRGRSSKVRIKVMPRVG